MKVKSVKVVSIDKPIRVYDITVCNGLSAQNFLVESGIILKNCGPVCHGRAAAQGSRTTFADMLPKHCHTHAISCGDFACNGTADAMTGY